MQLKSSLRFRLTLWNSAVLALLLGAFAYASWTALVVVLGQRGDAEVRESAQAIAQTIQRERLQARARGEEPRAEVAREALGVLRAGDLDVFIVDEASRVVATSYSALHPLSRAGSTEVRAGSAAAARKRTPVVPRTDSLAVASTDSPTAVVPDTLPAHVSALVRDARSTTVPLVRTVELNSGTYREAALRVPAGRDNSEEPAMVVAVIRSSEEDIGLLLRYRNRLLFAIPLALGFSILCGYVIARRSLAPVEAMADQAARISAATLDERLPVVNEHDELGRLATVVNALLERVHVAFLQQRQFVADASHELRTPIAIVRGEADVTLQRTTRRETEYREALGIISEESVRLTRIVDDLFLLARSDAGAPVAQYATLDIRDLALGALRSVRTIADDHDITLEQDVPDETLCIEGDAPLLRRLLLNLLDNALKFTPRGGTVGITLQRVPNGVHIVVRDTGPGVSDALRARVFDRFVRAGPDDRPASYHETPRASSGAGLGLAIAAAIATAHHGSLTLDDNSVGARFRVALPLAAPPPTGSALPRTA